MVFKSGESSKLLEKDQSTEYGSVVEITGKRTKRKQKEETSSILHLFKYSTKLDRTLLIIGALFSVISGSCLPILGLFFGGMTNIFLNQATQGLISDAVINATLKNATSLADPVAIDLDDYLVPLSTENHTIVYQAVHVLHEIFKAELPQRDLWENNARGNGSVPMTVREFDRNLNKYLIIYLIIGTIMMICSFIQTMCWEYVGEHQVHTMRKVYFSQIMRQDISWYDTNDNGNLPNKLSDDLERIRDGTGFKCVMIIQYVATFISGVAVGLYVNLSLTLVTLCVGPFLIGLTAYSAKFAALQGAREQEKYAAAGAVAEEALSNIKTVQAFCGFSLSIKKYDRALEEGCKIAMSKYNVFAVCFGLTFALMYAAYGLGFWYGSKLVQAGAASPGSVFTVFFSVVVGAFSIGNSLPYLNTVSTAVGVMAGIKQIMSRKVTIDPYSNEGRKLGQMTGNIEFRNISFCYPSRSNIPVLRNFNLKIKPGKTVALVGSSGAGKSTIVGLLLRFYDAQHGSICIDDTPIDELNVKWWREQIGLVSQEPVLFGVSIAENIRYGQENVSFWEIIDAAKNSNAHEFITRLPMGYDTLVGDTGSQLSGGQKQRIAIARALVRNPKILLLDEATSALDAHSEGVVQETLEQAMRGRTTIIVAHRLSTIRNADSIYVMKDGAVFESGKHDELMEKRSLYFNLVTAQTKSNESTDSENPISTSTDDTIDESLSPTEISSEEYGKSKLRPKQLLQELRDNGERYTTGFSTDEKRGRNNGEGYATKFSIGGEEGTNKEKLNSEEEDDEKPHWKVLDREVSHETLSDEDDDDEYETVVTHVRETRKILYSDDDEDVENERQSENPKKEEKSVKIPLSSLKRKNFSASEEDDKFIPLSQPEEIEKEMSLWDLLELHKSEWKWLLVTFIGCACAGAIMPIFSLYYGNIFSVFTKTGIELVEGTRFWTNMFILLSLFTAASFYCEAKGATTANEKVIARLRLLAFENILRQPVGWFDLETSSPGILVNRLARNAPLIKAAAGLRIGQVIASAVTVVGAFLIAYICGWKLALMLTACVPVIIWATLKQQSLLKQHQTRDSQSMDEAGRISSEAVRNIRTVQALGQEKLFAVLYTKNLEMPYREAKKQALIYAILYSATQAITFYMYALAFRAGGYFVKTGEMRTADIYKVFFALSLCAVSIGNAFSYLQDYSKARTSMRLLNYLLTRKSEIDATSPLGIKPDIKGEIQFKAVHFSYPSRPNVRVLRGLNLNVEAGKTLALVGESGCGKSTVITLLERFYDPIEGIIKIDGYDIRTLNVAHLRSKIGLVTQEPILFDISIKDNIAYGAISLYENISFEQVVNAAKLANVHDFVMKLPERYDTVVGERGIQLSGGQKQRVAIARALIRDPKILLLDEATSALDTENEKLVQEALDSAKKGRTCIVVAHRLSTIQNADKIYVMQKGKMIEKGTHKELLAKKGNYYQLTQRQVI